MEEELTFVDYYNTPLAKLSQHPDFSYEVLMIVGDICRMTGAELEKLNTYREKDN